MGALPETQAQSKAVLAQEEEEHFSYAMQLVTSAPLPMVLLAVFRLKVFEIISSAGPGAQLSASKIAADLPSKNPDCAVMLDRMLRLLASHSVLTCSTKEGEAARPERVYGLTPVAKYFLPNHSLNGASLGPLLALHQDKVFNESWYELENAVLEGGVPFNRVYGIHAFEYPATDPRFNEVFNKGMISHTPLAISRILETYKGFEQLQSLVDVGGGLGVTISLITSKYSNLKGVNFDLPHVIQHAPSYPGVQHIGGDMFESVPKGDAIFMKWILHDWDDEHCVKLLRNCYKSLPDDGKVIVAEAVLVNPPTETDGSCDTISSTSQKAACQHDMIMLAQNPGGKERTHLEFEALATAAGFRGINLPSFVCNLWIMEFYK